MTYSTRVDWPMPGGVHLEGPTWAALACKWGWHMFVKFSNDSTLVGSKEAVKFGSILL